MELIKKGEEIDKKLTTIIDVVSLLSYLGIATVFASAFNLA